MSLNKGNLLTVQQFCYNVIVTWYETLNKDNLLTVQQFCYNVIVTWYETLNKGNLLTVQQFSTILVKMLLWMSIRYWCKVS